MPIKSAIFVGSTEWAIIGAIACAEQMRSDGTVGAVALLLEGVHLDGITMTGPAATDIGQPGRRNRGIYQRWCKRLGRYYGVATTRVVEPRIAEAEFELMLREAGVHVYYNCQLASLSAVNVTATSGATVTMADGRTFTSSNWYDGSICMDLLGLAGAEGTHWVIGSEGEAEFGESLAGYGKFPIVKTGTAVATTLASGALRPQVIPKPALAVGAAYGGVQAFGPRMQYSRNPGQFIAWDKAKVDGVSILTGYDREQVAFLVNIFGTSGDIDNVGLGGGEMQDNGDYILCDANGVPRHWNYARLSYADRANFHHDWKLFAARWNYFRAFDPAFAGSFQNSMSTLNADGTRTSSCGYPKLEHTDNDYLPRLPYPRETRRARGAYTLAQPDFYITDTTATRNVFKSDSIAIFGYSPDTHPTSYVQAGANSFWIEGTRGVTLTGITTYAQGWSCPFRALYHPDLPWLAFGYPACTHTAWASERVVLNLCLAGEAAGRAMARAIATGVLFAGTDVVALRAILTAQSLYVDPLPTTIAPDDPDADDPDDPDDPDA